MDDPVRYIVKKFDELTVVQLYDVLKLRAAVFVVEQDCVYQDLDDNDQIALHVLGIKKEKIVAYSRIFKAGNYFDKASIGRVVVDFSERNYGHGIQLMKTSIKAVHTNFNTTSIKISAQLYLKDFYESLGFQQKGQTYLEDGIPHIAMIII